MKSDRKPLAKKIIRITPFLIVSIPCLWIMVVAGKLWLSWNPFIIWRPQQKQLATELGININDYPIPMYFPEGYFETKLSPGSDISEVHHTITGYSKVYNCHDREVYYFFDSGEDYSLRIEVQYNTDLTVEYVHGEDEDSRTISVGGCPEGLIKK
jgi:hypothetical protein